MNYPRTDISVMDPELRFVRFAVKRSTLNSSVDLLAVTGVDEYDHTILKRDPA